MINIALRMAMEDPEYVVSQEKGFTIATYQEWQIQHGETIQSRAASFEHETAEGLRFANDADFS